MNTKDGMKENNFEVIRPGVNTTYQDFGRKNLYHIGVPFSGAMDRRNYLIANRLINNGKDEPVIEFAFQGPCLKYFGNKRNIVIEGFSFAPTESKRDYMFELNTIITTMKFAK